MGNYVFIEEVKALMLNGLIVISPMLIGSLLIAVVFGIVQAMMQIQEQTLSFFPKLLTLFFLAYLLGSWMLERIVMVMKDYFQNITGFL